MCQRRETRKTFYKLSGAYLHAVQFLILFFSQKRCQTFGSETNEMPRSEKFACWFIYLLCTVRRKLVGPNFRFLEFCGLFVDYEFYNVSTSDRVAITHAKSKSTNNPHLTHKIRKSGPSSFRITTVS